MFLQELTEANENEMMTNSPLLPFYKPGYVLLLGSEHFFYQIKLFASIYERLVKARMLIQAKLKQEIFHPDNANGGDQDDLKYL